MDNRPQRALAGDRADQGSQLLALGDVTGSQLDRGAELFQLGLQLLRPFGIGAATPGKDQVGGIAMGGDVAGDEGTQGAGATGDQNRRAGVGWLRHPKHDLARVTALAHEAERLLPTAHVPAGDRRLTQSPGSEQLDDLPEHLLAAVGPRLA